MKVKREFYACVYRDTNYEGNTFGIFTFLVSFSKIISENRTLHRTDNRKELYETVRNKCAASYTILVLADYYPFNREQTFDIDDVTPTREKKKPIHSRRGKVYSRNKRGGSSCVSILPLSLLFLRGFFHQSSSRGRDKSSSVRGIGSEFYILPFVKSAKLSKLEWWTLRRFIACK